MGMCFKWGAKCGESKLEAVCEKLVWVSVLSEMVVVTEPEELRRIKDPIIILKVLKGV